jgi:hypothetical protein
MTKVEIHHPSDAMYQVGWVTISNISEGDTAVYGIFPTMEDAVSHGDKLINATAIPIYAPTIH